MESLPLLTIPIQAGMQNVALLPIYPASRLSLKRFSSPL